MSYRCVYRLLSIIIIFLILTSVFHPERHAKHYFYISIKDIFFELVESPEVKYLHSNVCSSEDVILNNHEISIKEIYKIYDYKLPFSGGEFVPKHCKARYKVAILIPFRKRHEQLRIFLNYFHNYLQNQNIHYRIYVVDQQDSAQFNRAKMFNIGAYEAMKADFPCLILHDVDLIPLTTGNIYACAKRPRHMSSSLDDFRFNLPYEGLFGGVIAVQSRQFVKINGMSNLFEGWGGEDDDLFRRLEAYDFVPYRFPPELSKYTMLKHKKAKPSDNRYKLLENTLERLKTDGLNSLALNHTVKEKPLYTHIIVT